MADRERQKMKIKASVRFSSKIGAVCGNSACTDLCGGRSVMGVPTTIYPDVILVSYFSKSKVASIKESPSRLFSMNQVQPI